MRAAFTPTGPTRTPLSFHRPPRPPRDLLHRSRLPRRSPPKISRLRPPRLRRSLHHQNRNANLLGLRGLRSAALQGGNFLCFCLHDLIAAWIYTSRPQASTITKAPPSAPASAPNPGEPQAFTAQPAIPDTSMRFRLGRTQPTLLALRAPLGSN